MLTTLVSASQLADLASDNIVILDCRHSLADPRYGEQAYAVAHIHGAHFVHLDRDLSGPCTGKNGRHPLPDIGRLASLFGHIGITADKQVIAYDDAGGMFAARAWWLLRWLGHEAVAVLDGGWQAWQQAQGQIDGLQPNRTGSQFLLRPALEQVVNATTVLQQLSQPDLCLIDARAPNRFAGQDETLDPVGGHIPGAKNRFFQHNLNADGTFKPLSQLRDEWQTYLTPQTAKQAIHQCGSGVTACHNLLALAHLGWHGGRLYAGSWSEWCSDPSRPIATGAVA